MCFSTGELLQVPDDRRMVQDLLRPNRIRRDIEPLRLRSTVVQESIYNARGENTTTVLQNIRYECLYFISIKKVLLS